MTKRTTKNTQPTPKMPPGSVVFYEGTDPKEAEGALLRTTEARVDSLRSQSQGNDRLAHLLSKARDVALRVRVERLGIHHDDEAATLNVAALGAALGSLAPDMMEYATIGRAYGYARLTANDG